MKTETKKVRHGGKVVDSADIPVYENITELVESETDERILNMFNKANCVRIMGNARAKHTEARVGKGKMFDLAFNTLTAEEASSFAGKVEALREFLESDEIAERVKALIAEESGTEDVEEAA